MSLTPPPAGPPSATTAAGLPVIPYRWVVLFSLCAANWAMTLPTLSLGLLLPEIDKTFGINDTQGGWLGASIRIGPTLMMLPAALMMSRFNPLHMTSLSWPSAPSSPSFTASHRPSLSSSSPASALASPSPSAGRRAPS